MFRINHIKLIQFRNYLDHEFHFSSKITGICGLNGRGKTNLLDAIYQLCFTKSYFGKPDLSAVSTGMTGFRITGHFEKNDEQLEISLALRETRKKELLVNGEIISPFSLHIGRMPVVFVAPDDVELITGASEGRRKMTDAILSQLNRDYLSNLIKYNKVLEDRNAYLKRLSDGDRVDEVLMNTFDDQLAFFGTAIIDFRVEFFSSFIPNVLSNYATISNGLEQPGLNYLLSVQKDQYLDILKRNRQKDILLQRTTVGVHKDELEITMNGTGFKLTASQGQRKSMLFAMKLAEFNLLKSHFGFEPILLLDDIFEKLDQERLSKLLHWVCVNNNGQVILTDTHADRVKKLLEEINLTYTSIILD